MSCSLYITIGIPGSGKSTGIKKLLETVGAVVICPDDIREEVSVNASNPPDSSDVWKIAFSRLHKNLEDGQQVIFEDTSVNPKARKPLIKIGKKHNCEIVACVFPVTLQTAIKRQGERERKVPDHVIESFYNRFKIPVLSEGFDKILVFK